MGKWGTPKREGSQALSDASVLNYDFGEVEGKTVKDASTAGSLAFPQRFFDGLSHMPRTMDVCAESDEATVFPWEACCID